MNDEKTPAEVLDNAQTDSAPAQPLDRGCNVVFPSCWNHTNAVEQSQSTSEPWGDGEILGDHDDAHDPEALGAAFAGLFVLGLTGLALWMFF